jgi:hypothetical protein
MALKAWVFLVWCSFAATCQCSSAAREPDGGTGKPAGPVQFDAVLDLDSPSSLCRVTLFARYWVAAEYYQVSVIWAEPNGRGLFYPVYPATLSVASDAHAMTISHGLFPQHNQTHLKPLGAQPLFTNMFGDYSLGALRFSERDSVAARARLGDQSEWPVAMDKSEAGLLINLASVPESANWEPAFVVARRDRDLPKSVDFLTNERRLWKGLVYEHDPLSRSPILRKQTVVLPERPIALGLPGEGSRVSMGDKTFTIREFEAKYHAGGRIAEVELVAREVNGQTVVLPAKVDVRNGNGGKLLRSARFMNYHGINMTGEEAKKAAMGFGGFSEAHLQYRNLLVKHWKAPPQEIPAEDRRLMGHLCEVFQKAECPTLGEQMRRLNILMELHRFLGDREALRRDFQAYLGTMADHKLNNTLLVGGGGAVDTLMLWSRFEEANDLLGLWVEAARSCIEDLNLVIDYAARETTKGNFWLAFSLLEGFSDRFLAKGVPGLLFESTALRTIALAKLGELCKKKGSIQDEIPRQQVKWVTSTVNETTLHSLLTKSLEATALSLRDLTKLTPAQQELRKKLEAIQRGDKLR